MPDDTNDSGIPTVSDVDSGEDVSAGSLPVPGQTWGKYLIEKFLGSGGQATVFQAFDTFGPAGHVAIKLPKNLIPASRIAAWTQNEVDPLDKLDHPNIVRILDAGEVNGVPYVATQLIQGLPLSAHVQSNPPSIRRILDWMIQLLGAAAHAHEWGIVHRDLKPSNIIVTPQSQPRIIDFGISSLIDPYHPEYKPRSSGTLFFMPPEQAGGDSQADHRIDIFALGGILKILLTGAGPYGPLEQAKQAFEGILAGEGSSDDVRQRLRAFMAENVEFVAEGSGPTMRRALARIANRALRVDPEKRFRNAREMLRALGGLRNRRRFLAAGAAAVLAAIVIATTAFLRDGPQIPVSPAPPTASLEVHFQRAGQKGSYQILAPDLLPLRTGDKIQIHATLSEALVAYLVAVGPDGRISVLYPSEGEKPQPAGKIDIPTGRNQWLPLADPTGTETILLLARREPLKELAELKKQLASFGPPPRVKGQGLLVAGEKGVQLLHHDAATHRSISKEVVDEEKGMLAGLLEAVPRKWTVVRAISFPHASEADGENSPIGTSP